MHGAGEGHSATGTAATEQQNAFAARGGAEGFFEGIEKTGRIGVIAKERTIGQKDDGVDSTQGLRGFGESMFGGEESIGGFFVGNGDVEAAILFGAKIFEGARDVAGLNIEEGIGSLYAESLEGGVVHGRRKRMTDGVAEEGERG